jgi:hypothetical protein
MTAKERAVALVQQLQKLTAKMKAYCIAPNRGG